MPITVRDLADNPSLSKKGKLFLDTAWGKQQVSVVRQFSDGPWIVCPKMNAGFGSSFAVTWDQELRIGE